MIDAAAASLSAFSTNYPVLLSDRPVASWPVFSLKRLVLSGVSKEMADHFSKSFANVSALHINLSLTLPTTLSTCLNSLPKLCFLRLQSLPDPNYFHGFSDAQYPVSHLKLSSVTSLSEISISFLAHAFPKLFFLSLDCKSNTPFATPATREVCFPELRFLCLKQATSLSTVKILLESMIGLQTLYLGAADFKAMKSKLLVSDPGINVLYYGLYPEYCF